MINMKILLGLIALSFQIASLGYIIINGSSVEGMLLNLAIVFLYLKSFV